MLLKKQALSNWLQAQTSRMRNSYKGEFKKNEVGLQSQWLLFNTNCNLYNSNVINKNHY